MPETDEERDDRYIKDYFKELKERQKTSENPWPKSSKGHHWSGWPGAYCMKCGAEHAMENAIGMSWYDPTDGSWDTEEHRKIVIEADSKCGADNE